MYDEYIGDIMINNSPHSLGGGILKSKWMQRTDSFFWKQGHRYNGIIKQFVTDGLTGNSLTWGHLKTVFHVLLTAGRYVQLGNDPWAASCNSYDTLA